MRLWIGRARLPVQGRDAWRWVTHLMASPSPSQCTHTSQSRQFQASFPPSLSLHRGGDAPLGSLLPEEAAMKRWLGGSGPFFFDGGEERKLEAFQDSGNDESEASGQAFCVCVAPRIFTRPQPCWLLVLGCLRAYQTPGPGPGPSNPHVSRRKKGEGV